MVETLKSLNEGLREGDVYISWTCKSYNPGYRFMKIDSLVLNVLQRVKETSTGTVAEYLRIPPCYFVGKRMKEPRIRYSLNNSYRVTSGKRKGQIVPIENINENERWCSVGMRKELNSGSKGFDLDNKLDRDILKHLGTWAPQPYVEDIETYIPDLYITIKIPTLKEVRKAPRLIVRKTGRALRYIRQLPVFDSNKSLEENLPAVKTSIAVDAGNGRLGYDFNMFYGRGVVAADCKESQCTVGDWYKVSRLSMSTGVMEID